MARREAGVSFGLVVSNRRKKEKEMEGGGGRIEMGEWSTCF